MSTAMPQIPPRPTRAQEQKAGGGSSLSNDIPKIPPRPINRRLDRSISPTRESFARSPLNETPFSLNHGNQSKSSLYSLESPSGSTSDLPRRPSSVALPSIGQEGSEYAEAFATPEDLATSPTTRNVANDLKLHAPKPSLPLSSAKQRVSAVTRTDSGQAAAFGIGKASSDDKDPSTRVLKAKASFASQTSNGTERPPSSPESEHGIPEIGQRVPMYPNAGDVQAPSPSPFTATHAPGVGFHNDGTKPRHHGRRTSGRGVDIPFDAYGKHGHGQLPHDRFEKAYYEKHPELLKKETSHYHGPFAEDRPEWAMSSEDLNKIVRDTARGTGLGHTPAVMGTPTEQIGFQASQEYASRISSPRPHSSGYHVAHSNTSQTHMDSPLRKESSASETAGKAEFEKTLSRSLHAPSDTALESEIEDEDTIHVDEPGRRINKIYGGAGRLESTEDLGPHTGNGGDEDGIHDELGYGAPILASDEVAKEPFGWELQPAVSPLNERRGSVLYDEHNIHPRSASASSLSGSRPTSRPGSIHGNVPGLRLPSDRPLEDLDEYEPLFPDEKAESASVKKPLTVADKLKRPELKNRKFPSQDIWEDSPNSLQYTATVSMPQLPEDRDESLGSQDTPTEHEDETPEQAFARRQEELAEAESKDSDSFLNREKKPWAHKSHLLAETRPGMKQRFPSRDIWEDTPDSLQLQTTVGGPQSEDKDALSPPSERPTTGAVTYHQEKAAAGLPLTSEEGRATTGIAAIMKPHVPARPTKAKPAESSEKSQPAIPLRPAEKSQQVDNASPPLPLKTKPQVPARPSKPITRSSSENVPLAVARSDSSAAGSDQGPAAKPKPPVPSRPVGSKIAALQSGFMLDLNKRLQLGPQAPKKEEAASVEAEEEKEMAPLVDARKGRARGPARRAPAKSPTPSSDLPVERSKAFEISTPSTLWSIDPEEQLLRVPSSQAEDLAPSEPKVPPSETPILTSNTAAQVSLEPSETTPKAARSVSPPAAKETHAEPLEEAQEDAVPTGDEVKRKKSSEDPSVIVQSIPEPETVEEDLSGSTATVKTNSEAVE